ncbi:hypothetical protein BGZ99_000972 [Dissophora globulifera]|uniref:Xaa-Pro dipeptidyl-peptidase-like domain-containing protein n=1 Tax=Dissophora globulifera TaxID=979702 RepID=A0A9P6RR23_9FUNG|nr:hypothetical protein BGZ99_000972 [Dissophora globulifera]
MARSDVSFQSGNLKLAGHLYVPTTASDGKKLPAIITVHPFGAVKEQAAGVYADILSQTGDFVTLAFDRRHQGASEGEPRQLEDGPGMVEDVKAAVTYLSMLDNVDPNRIGVLGICAGGGYALCATTTDPRIKATATVSGVDVGSFMHKIPKDQMLKTIADGALDRIEYARTGTANYVPILPQPSEVTKDTPTLLAEGSEYYLTPRGQYKTSINRTVTWSYDMLAPYNSFVLLDWMVPRPLLFIAGSKADTLGFSEEAFAKAQDPKELFLIQGRTHIDLYDKAVPEVSPKLIDFFIKHL